MSLIGEDDDPISQTIRLIVRSGLRILKSREIVNLYIYPIIFKQCDDLLLKDIWHEIIHDKRSICFIPHKRLNPG